MKLTKNDWLLYVAMVAGAIAVYPFIIYLEMRYKEK